MPEHIAFLTLIAHDANRALADLDNKEFVRTILQGIIWAVNEAKKDEFLPITH